MPSKASIDICVTTPKGKKEVLANSNNNSNSNSNGNSNRCNSNNLQSTGGINLNPKSYKSSYYTSRIQEQIRSALRKWRSLLSQATNLEGAQGIWEFAYITGTRARGKMKKGTGILFRDALHYVGELHTATHFQYP